MARELVVVKEAKELGIVGFNWCKGITAGYGGGGTACGKVVLVKTLPRLGVLV